MLLKTRARFVLSFLVFSVLFISGPAQGLPPIPLLHKPVTDEAGLLNADTKQVLNRALTDLWHAGGSQTAVLIVPSLQGTAVEEYSIKVVEKWKLGSESGDNGILLLISTEDHKMRIEVGQGLEGSLTDAHSKRIIDDTVSPLFRAGRFDEGVIAGVHEILKYTDPKFNLETYLRTSMPLGYQRSAVDSGGGLPIGAIILLFIVMSLFLSPSRMGGYRGRSAYGHWGGIPRGFGGFRGGGGGGGFSGGGGNFSGGGASGEW